MGCIRECTNFFKTLAADIRDVEHLPIEKNETDEMKLESVILRIAGVVGAIFASCIALSALLTLPFAPISAIVLLSLAGAIAVASHDAIQMGINESSLIKTLDSLDERDWISQLAQIASRAQVLARAGLSEYNGVSWKLQGTWLFKEISPLL